MTKNMSNNNKTTSNLFAPITTPTEMYTDRIACCPVVSHVEYAPTGPTDGRHTVTLRFPLDSASVIIILNKKVWPRQSTRCWFHPAARPFAGLLFE